MFLQPPILSAPYARRKPRMFGDIEIQLHLRGITPARESEYDLFVPFVQYHKSSSETAAIELDRTMVTWSLPPTHAQELLRWEQCINRALEELTSVAILTEFAACVDHRKSDWTPAKAANWLCYFLNRVKPRTVYLLLEDILDETIHYYNNCFAAADESKFAQGTSLRQTLCDLLRTMDCFSDAIGSYAPLQFTVHASFVDSWQVVLDAEAVSQTRDEVEFPGFHDQFLNAGSTTLMSPQWHQPLNAGQYPSRSKVAYRMDSKDLTWTRDAGAGGFICTVPPSTCRPALYTRLPTQRQAHSWLWVIVSYCLTTSIRCEKVFQYRFSSIIVNQSLSAQDLRADSPEQRVSNGPLMSSPRQRRTRSRSPIYYNSPASTARPIGAELSAVNVTASDLSVIRNAKLRQDSVISSEPQSPLALRIDSTSTEMSDSRRPEGSRSPTLILRCTNPDPPSECSTIDLQHHVESMPPREQHAPASPLSRKGGTIARWCGLLERGQYVTARSPKRLRQRRLRHQADLPRLQGEVVKGDVGSQSSSPFSQSSHKADGEIHMPLPYKVLWEPGKEDDEMAEPPYEPAKPVSSTESKQEFVATEPGWETITAAETCQEPETAQSWPGNVRWPRTKVRTLYLDDDAFDDWYESPMEMDANDQLCDSSEHFAHQMMDPYLEVNVDWDERKELTAMPGEINHLIREWAECLSETKVDEMFDASDSQMEVLPPNSTGGGMELLSQDEIQEFYSQCIAAKSGCGDRKLPAQSALDAEEEKFMVSLFTGEVPSDVHSPSSSVGGSTIHADEPANRD